MKQYTLHEVPLKIESEPVSDPSHFPAIEKLGAIVLPALPAPQLGPGEPGKPCPVAGGALCYTVYCSPPIVCLTRDQDERNTN